MQKHSVTLAVIVVFLFPCASIAKEKQKSKHIPTVYGKVRASYNFTDIDGGLGDDSFISSNASRLGFKGKYKSDRGITLHYQVETGVKVNGDGSDHLAPLRDTFVGASSKSAGKIRIGNIDTAYKKATTKIDIFGGSVADYNQVIGAASGAKHSKFFNIRAKEVIVYNSPKFSGIDFALSYSDNHTSSDNDTTVQNLSFRGAYTNKQWYATFAHERQSKQQIGVSLSDDTVSGTKFGLMYKSKPWRFGMVYESTDDDLANSAKSRDAIYLNSTYTAGRNVLKAMVWQADESDAGNDGANGFALGVAHKFTKHVEFYVYYTAIDNDSNGKYGFNAAFVPTITPGASNNVSLGSAPGADLSSLSIGFNFNFGY